MRIISGKYKKKIISPPKNFKLRPTTDIAKEALFNIIANNFDIENISVLDLFSGTGSISYEFASRGCEKIVCVEKNYKHISFIKSTVEKLNFSQIKAIKADVFSYLNSSQSTFDLIFADPPYDLKEIDKIPERVFANNLLNKNSWLIVEHSEKTDFSETPYFKELRAYSKVHFSIFEKKYKKK
ncbi:MAG: 16S rRNA (guanine(966)-N(2))-methyltransferase RsmD [Bacteroidetes bacterium]|nr:MAG: 16S rRNA (guanine(966)-N(2))-methyltransferase RsmD [Bacteroidota bacterium]